MSFLFFLLLDRTLLEFDVRAKCPANLLLRKCPLVVIRVNCCFSNLDTGRLVTQNGQREPIVVTSLGAADLGLRLLELCLTQLNNGA